MVRKTGGTRKKAKVSGHRKHHRSRRRRISGTGDFSGMLEKAGGLIVGAVAARELNTLVSGFVTISPMISGFGQIAAGVLLPKFAKGAFFQNVGDGMIANGGMVVVVSTGLISGASDRMAYQINGTANLPVLSGTANLPVVNGVTTRIANSQAPQKTVYVKNPHRFNPMVM